MLKVEPVSYGEFNGEAMGVSALKGPFQPCFSTMYKEKNQQLHFCKLLILRAENEIAAAAGRQSKLTNWRIAIYAFLCRVLQTDGSAVRSIEKQEFS